MGAIYHKIGKVSVKGKLKRKPKKMRGVHPYPFCSLLCPQRLLCALPFTFQPCRFILQWLFPLPPLPGRQMGCFWKKSIAGRRSHGEASAVDDGGSAEIHQPSESEWK